MAKKELNSLLENIDPDSDLNFYGVDLLDEKAFTLFVKRNEFLCRKSQEYEMWSKRTKAFAINQNSDPERNDAEFCPICKISYEFASAESHHHPVTLFNIVVRHFQAWIDNNELSDKRPLDLVQEVMEDHLCGEVEHVVLCKHCHEKYHNGEQVTREELQKIIDYKRSQKVKDYPQTLKELVELKKSKEQLYKDRRIQDTRDTLGDLGHSNIDRASILNSLMQDIGATDFYENIKTQTEDI